MTDRLDEQIWLSVPFAEKDEAKALKAKWCPVRRLWWTSLRNLDANLGLAKWLPDGGLKERCLTAQRWLAEHEDVKTERVLASALKDGRFVRIDFSEFGRS